MVNAFISLEFAKYIYGNFLELRSNLLGMTLVMQVEGDEITRERELVI